MRLHACFSLTSILLVVLSAPATADSRGVELKDAYAIRSIGTIAAEPNGKLYAMELAGKIVIVDAASNATVETLDGQGPVWAPSRRRLAYIAQGEEGRQLHVWDADSGEVTEVTHLEGGISPSPAGNNIDDQSRMAWSPDAAQIAFTTRIMGEYRALLPPAGQAPMSRVFGPQAPASHAVLEGLFGDDSYWAAYGLPADEAARMSAIDRSPELGGNHLVIVDVDSGRSRTMKHQQSYYALAWSPDGRRIAAIVDVTRRDGSQWMRAYQYVGQAAVALVDVSSGKEELVVPPARILMQPRWARSGAFLYFRAYIHRSNFDRARALRYSVASGEWTAIALPGEQAVTDLRLARDGRSLLAMMEERFAPTLWKADLDGTPWRQVDTHGWVIDSYAELGKDTYLLNAEGPHFKGRLYRSSTGSSARAPELLLDANPQLADLRLGEQRRVTWKNKAGDDVDGIVILPPNYDAACRYPLIIESYPGTPTDNLKLRAGAQIAGQLQAARGYVVFRPGMRVPRTNYWFPRGEEYTNKARGSAGIPILVDDITSGVKFLADGGLVDPEHVGVLGHSNGAWAANFLMTESSLPKATVISNGINSSLMLSFFPVGAIQTAGDDLYTYGNVFDNTNSLIELSPILKMRNVTSSVLILMGDKDWPHVPQLISQYQTLRAAEKDVELVRYANEGHFFADPLVVEDAFNRVNRFFDEKLKGGPSVQGAADCRAR